MTNTVHLPTSFSDTERETWATLFDGYLRRLYQDGCRQAIAGFEKLGLGREIEDMGELDDRLAALSGWRMEPVDGLLPNTHFYGLLRDRRFPVAPALRTPAELEFCDRPDLFHDVTGHLPFLMDADFGDFLQRLGEIALHHVDDEAVLRAFDRFYWFTAETGLVIEGGETRILGAAVLTSGTESANALGERTRRVALNIDRVFATEFGISELQPEYFVAASYPELLALADGLPERARNLRNTHV